MAFNQFKLDESFNQARGIFNEYVYGTEDTKSEVMADGYFSESRFADSDNWLGSLITCSCSDGFITGNINDTSSLVDPLYPFNPTSGITIERLMDGVSTASDQQPSGTGQANSIQIEYGPAISTTPISLDASGKITINESGTYRIKVALQFGRTGGAGTSKLFFRALINGVQAGRSISAFISNANEEQYFENDTWLTVPAGLVITFEVMRDDDGNNSGGLFEVQPTLEAGSWNNAPCAAIRIERWA